MRAAASDLEVVFPRRALDGLAAEGFTGKRPDADYSFVGACAQSDLRKDLALSWAEQLREDGVDAAVLVATWPLCHTSVGHVARAFEAEGLPSVAVITQQFRPIATEMRVARALATPHLMGRTVGPARDRARQGAVVWSAVELLPSAVAVGVIDFPDVDCPTTRAGRGVG